MKKRISALVLAIAMLLSVVPTVAATETAGSDKLLSAPTTAAPAAKSVFTDTAGTFYESAAAKWADRGVINGVDTGIFYGSGTATRGQAAKTIVLAAGFEVLKVPDSFYAEFKDVVRDAWYAPYVYTLYVKGIMKGDGASHMYPEALLTRQEYVVLTGRAFGVAENAYGLTFSNLAGKDKVADWAKGMMGAYIAMGVISGDETGNINANMAITRGEMVVIIDRLVVDYITKGGEYELKGKGIVVVATTEGVELTGELDGNVIIGEKASAVIFGAKGVKTLTVNGGTVIVDGEADLVAAYGASQVTISKTAEVTAASASGKGAVLTVVGSLESAFVEGATLTTEFMSSVESIGIGGEGSKVNVGGKTGVISDDKSAKGTEIIVEVGSSVEKVTFNGTDSKIEGVGQVGSVEANGKDITVNTLGTSVTAGKDAENVKAGGKPVAAGDTVKTNGTPAASTPPASSTPNVSAPMISEQPKDLELKYNGAPGKLSITHSGQSGATYIYKWYVNTTDSNTGGVALANSGSTTYTVPVNDESVVGKTLYYYCTVTAVLGSKTATATSETAAVTVTKQALKVYAVGEYPVGSYDMTSTLAGLINAEKDVEVEITAQAAPHEGGWSTYHLYEACTFDSENICTGVNSTKAVYKYLEENTVDYLILQSSRHMALFNDTSKNKNYQAAIAIARMAAEKNPNVQVIILAPYAHSVFNIDNHNNDFGAEPTANKTIDSMESHVKFINTDARAMAANVNNSAGLNIDAKIAYVSDAFMDYSDSAEQIASDLYRPALNNGAIRGNEPGNRSNALGAYLTAAVLYNTMFGEAAGKSPAYLGAGMGDLSADGDGSNDGANTDTKDVREALGLTAEEIAAILQNTAAQNFVTYTVEVYMQNTEDDGYSLDSVNTKTFTAPKGSYVVFNPELIEHATADTSMEGTVLQGRIADDGSTVFKVFYNRAEYKVSYEYSNYLSNTQKPALPETQTYRWGQTVNVAADPIWEGYVFSGWNAEEVTPAEGTFEMPQGDVTFYGKWAKEGVNPVFSVNDTAEVSGVTNAGLHNSAWEFDALTGTLTITLDYNKDLASAGLDATEKYAAVLSLSGLVEGGKVEIDGIKGGVKDTQSYDIPVGTTTLDVLWAFEEGETALAIRIFDEQGEVAYDMPITVAATYRKDINIFVSGSWAIYDENVNADLLAMFKDLAGTDSVEITKVGVNTSSNTYNVYDLFSWSGTTCTGISSGVGGSALKKAISAETPYDYIIIQSSTEYTGFKGDYTTKEQNGLLKLQEEMIAVGCEAELILYAPNALRQGFSEAGYNARSYTFKPSDWPLLKTETDTYIYGNSRVNFTDIFQMRANMLKGLLDDADTENKVTVKIANVTEAFEYYCTVLGEENDLYRTESGGNVARKLSAYRNRGNDNGAFLTAAIIAATTLDKDVRDLTITGAEGFTIDADMAALLTEVAYIFAGEGKEIATKDDLTVDLTTTPVTVTPASGMGTVTVYYNGSTTVPTKAGHYLVTVDIASGDGFAAAKGIVLGEYVVDGETAGASVSLTSGVELQAGLTADKASVAHGETMTLSGALRYNSKVKGHTVTLTVTGTAGDKVVASSAIDKPVEATIAEGKTSVDIEVPVHPDARTVEIAVEGATSAEHMTVKLDDEAQLTFNLIVVGDGHISGISMTAYGWIRDIMTNAGYTVTVETTTAQNNYLMKEVFGLDSDGNLIEGSAGASTKAKRLAILKGMLENSETDYYDFTTFKFDVMIVPVNRRGCIQYTSTFETELEHIKKLEEVLYANNPDAEMLILAGAGSYYETDISSYGSVASQEQKTRANAVKIKAALDATETPLKVTIFNFSLALGEAIKDADSMQDTTTANLALGYCPYGTASSNRMKLGANGAAMLYYMIMNRYAEIDFFTVKTPAGFYTTPTSSSVAWGVNAGTGPIAAYWANETMDMTIGGEKVFVD